MGFSQSDLAVECGVCEGEGVRVQRVQGGGCEVLRVRIESEGAAARIGKPQGRYVTVDCGSVCELDEREEERVCRAVAVEIREMAQRMCQRQIGGELCVLAVGLGNAEMTADALGPQAVRALSVTRHLPREMRAFLGGNGACDIAAILPGVPGQTGMETAELIRGAVLALKPDLVIAVDALAARAPARLAATVQLCDAGIRPGSGVGQKRRALTQETLGVPVMALGMPTVIRCDTLLADALGAQDAARLAGLDGMRDLCVCPKEIDLIVTRAGRLLARAIEKAFQL